jgi:hypothetical protein
VKRVTSELTSEEAFVDKAFGNHKGARGENLGSENALDERMQHRSEELTCDGQTALRRADFREIRIGRSKGRICPDFCNPIRIPANGIEKMEVRSCLAICFVRMGVPFGIAWDAQN